jgi:hypothetical protein
MKIIFLDFDGVLNSLDEIVHSGCYGGGTPLHTRHIEACEFMKDSLLKPKCFSFVDTEAFALAKI